jgi:hypothetical protein
MYPLLFGAWSSVTNNNQQISIVESVERLLRYRSLLLIIARVQQEHKITTMRDSDNIISFIILISCVLFVVIVPRSLSRTLCPYPKT